MTKAELLKRLESVRDDEDVDFAILSHSTRHGYHWTLLNPTLTHDSMDEPANVIGLTTTPIKASTLKNLQQNILLNK